MRLLNVDTFELTEFFDSNIPPYAILSHTWGSKEFTFQDLQREGYKGGDTKIDGMCRAARLEGINWVWIDTCCIDKSSSAELSEAINSMFTWYKNAEVCHVYLGDVPEDDFIIFHNSRFRHSRWFTRGWTLQELLAAPKLVFHNCSWQRIQLMLKRDLHAHSENAAAFDRGLTRRSQVLDFATLLVEITGIDAAALTTRFDQVCRRYSVARKMSWAAHRQTTRVEDRAYSLLGLFNVNMPLLYGEGPKAFFRLQEEILKSYDDQTLFAWGYNQQIKVQGGLFAKSPADFGGCGWVTKQDHGLSQRPHYYLTNKGLHIETQLAKMPPGFQPYVYALLNCSATPSLLNEDPSSQRIALPLQCVNSLVFRPVGVVPLLLPHSIFKDSSEKLYINIGNSLNDLMADQPYDERRLLLMSPLEINLNFSHLFMSLVETYCPPEWNLTQASPGKFVWRIDDKETAIQNSAVVLLRFRAAEADVALKINMVFSGDPNDSGSQYTPQTPGQVTNWSKKFPQGVSLVQYATQHMDETGIDDCIWSGHELQVSRMTARVGRVTEELLLVKAS
ncbi:Vegetative incompatibility protein HET-E-1-like protein 1 [Colletotrichum chlorophyti]|uniref:Vegetative incompatibility protein HET-E-1-like protein 1 n=1 Tax=Colletotrichum chlorophyti TaxID=708187 RepID=A0A1Q8RUD4_9PEZI|nr:Vegetative incompatibility protein HET-E-1-like protein 1 [Colletotrichum chlorophyti]